MRPQSILVIESDPKATHIFDDYFSSRGHSVFLTDNGKEAYELALSNDYDLITANAELSKADGSLIAEAISFIKPASRIVLVFNPKHVDQNLERTMQRVAATIQLPLTMQELARTMAAFGI